MKKVKHILATFLHSIVPQDNYYPKLLHTPFQFSLRYYIVVISLFSVLLMAIVGLHCTPHKMDGYRQSFITTLSGFPSDAFITVNHGLLESNQLTPLFLWLHHNNQPRLVFMIYTKDVPDTSRITLPLVLFGRDDMRFTYRGQTIVRPYDPTLSTFISNATIYKYITEINVRFQSFLIGFYFFFILLIPLVFIAGSTLSIFISSVVVYMLLRTFIPHIHFKKCLQAGLHGTHIPLLIGILLYYLFPTSPNMGIICIALTFVFTLVATYEMYSKEITHFKGL